MAAPCTYTNPLESLTDFFVEVSKAFSLFPTHPFVLEGPGADEWVKLLNEVLDFQLPRVEVILPSVELISPQRDGDEIMRFLEGAIRTAYKSEDKIGPGSHIKILKLIMSLKHESTLEHVGFTFRIIGSRGFTHELVRARIASYTQESTRYVGYDKHLPQAILPWHLLSYNDPNMCLSWHEAMEIEFGLYLKHMKQFGWKAQEARGFLPNDCKTEIVMTMNIRELRLWLGLRTDPAAHPDMQVIAREILRQLMTVCPLLFQDIQDKVDKQVAA
jgi:thymidylate synthase (FAD)